MANSDRTEYGYSRTKCACNDCATNCKFMPGFLIPSDIARMCPDESKVFEWALTALLASPGALVMRQGQTFNIPTLVPATKPDGSCINLSSNDLCTIHPVAPFGCAFFDCSSTRYDLSAQSLQDIMREWVCNGLYAQIWQHLYDNGKRQISATILRQRMTEYLSRKGRG